MKDRHADHTPQAGFTLLELLVGLTLLGFLSMLVMTGYQVATLSTRRVEDWADRARDLEASYDFLRDRLSQAYPAFVTDGSGAWVVDFAGRNDRIEFLAPLPQRFGAGDIVRYQISEDGGALNLTWRLDRPGEQHPAGSHSSLLGGLTVLSFQYFGATELDGGPRWQRSWVGRSQLPQLIRVHFEGDRNGRWPDLLVRPRIAADLDCTFDPADAKCRRR